LIHIHALNTSGIELLVNVYFRVGSYAEELQARDELTREILEQARRFGVEVGSTTQRITLAHEPEAGGTTHTPRRLPPPHLHGADQGNGEALKVRRDA
jgi:hypothetical protein